ncbi:MAG TPA: SAM-dependent methyltransferase [Mycobacterium sp.]
MPRTDNDTWNLATSVGVTATMVAAARAAATRSDSALIADPFAEPLVSAVGVDVMARLARGEADVAELDDDAVAASRRFTDAIAVRTKFFDDFFDAAGASGVRQAVILAAGLDSRAYRLAWPQGTVVFEIDQPPVVDFKTREMAALGAQPTAERRAVAIDLRDDWPAALRAAGFDPGKPAAWIAEGLLGYLPPEAQDRLLDDVTGLSAPGSRFATETAANPGEVDRDEMKQRMQTASERWRRYGFDVNLADLVYIGDRNDVTAYLGSHGWEITGATASELFARYGLEEPEQHASTWGELMYVDGILK